MKALENDIEVLNRWRLVLGKFSEESINFENNNEYMEMDSMLEFLYGREYGENEGMRGEKKNIGGHGKSKLTVPKWVTNIKELFPKETVEILERHGLERYNMIELLNNKEVLEELEPNKELLKSILQMKHLMGGEVIGTAKSIVKKVSDEIRKELESDIRSAIIGKVNKYKNSNIKSIRNLNYKKTIEKNLKNYNKDNNTLVIDRVYFNDNIKRFNKWNIVIAVDESGSMLDSVIHSAVMAGIFASLPMINTKLIIFDTEVVDLSYHIDDIVETLMSVQLGGGTYIYKALKYCYSLIENPSRTIVVMVTDLCEGGNINEMYKNAKEIMDTGSKLIVLTSLDSECTPIYNKEAAQKLRDLGAHVAAMTPEGLSKWIAKIIS